MKPDEITRRLEQVKLVYPAALGNAIGKEEIAADLKALTAAIQAVTALEEIDQALHGHCEACKHAEKRTYEPPCNDCVNCGPFDDDTPDRWEFRWPLEEEAEHEAH